MFRIRKPRYADVAATAALVLALGTGGAYASGLIHTNQIANNAVTAPKLSSAVRGELATPLTWHNLQLGPGVNGGCYTSTPQYAVRSGIVYFQGTLCSVTAGEHIFTIPTAIRPHLPGAGSNPILYFPVDQCDGDTGRIRIYLSTGEALVNLDGTNSSGSTCFLSLEGISYPLT